MPESCDGNLTSHCAAARARLTMFSSAFHASECHAAVSVASSRCVALTPDRERARTTDCALARAVGLLGARQGVRRKLDRAFAPMVSTAKSCHHSARSEI